jgi:ankyrin repeat protein
MNGRSGSRLTQQRSRRLREAYRSGDMAEVKAVLGWPEAFPNSPQPMDLAAGDWPLVTAINLGPLRFIRQLLDLGADPNFDALDGFPSLFVAIDARRPDLREVFELLLHYGARTNQRGINDWTPLHYAVARRNLPVVKLLLSHGADPNAPTRIDDLSTALEDAKRAGFADAVAAMVGPPA